MGSRIDFREEGGAALIMALGVMTIMVIIGVLVTTVSMNATKTVGHDIRLSEAQNIAEAGIDEAIALTLANYYEVYPDGIPDYPGDGLPFFEGPRQPTDSQGNVIGSYEVWTKEDPDRPGNVLLTAAGTSSGDNPDTSMVRVSVTYTANIFDYVLLPGTPTNPSDTEFRAGNGDDDSSGGGNSSISVTGKVHVNGNMLVNTPIDGDSDDSSGGNPGTVSFLSRPGYVDTVTYTGSFTGDLPSGNQPIQDDTVSFPTIDFASFSNTITVNMPSSGAPAGWTRSGNTFTISAQDFEQRYGTRNVVIFTSSRENTIVQITGNCNASNPAVITPTLMVSGDSVASRRVTQLNIVGPGLALRPDNGLAILTGSGKVQLQDGVEVGRSGTGALIYMSGQNGASEFEVNGNFTLYGSIVVNSSVLLGAITGDDDSGSDDDGSLCDSGSDSGSGGPDGASIDISYDSAFLTTMPSDWWGGGDLTALKANFERD